MELRVENLNKSYATQQVLRDLNFRVSSGQIVGFLGVNGAGKSTTMRILCGILRADTGQIFLDNQEFNPARASRTIGYLSEHNPLYGDLFVWEYLDFIAQVRQIPKRRQVINELLERLGIIEERKKKLEQLSKGYRQRVGLVAALIHKPQILILDEPSSGLDPKQMIEIRKLISEFGQERMVILSSHILQEVTNICNHIMIIHQGSIVVNSPREELQTRSLQVRWQNPVSASELEPLRKYCRELRAYQDFWLFYPNSTQEIPESLQLHAVQNLRDIILRFSLERGWELQSLSESKDELESVFQRVTGL